MEIEEENIMSVEVAIRRELEYRRKMEALQFKLPSDYDIAATIQAQEPPSGSGRKRKAPSSSTSNHQSYPTPQPQPQASCSYQQPFLNQPTSIGCKVCNQTFQSPLYLKQHCMGQKHQMNLMKMKSTAQKSKVQEQDFNNPYWCGLCQAGCSSAVTLEQHLVGKRHADAVEAMEHAKKNNDNQAQISKAELESLKWNSIS